MIFINAFISEGKQHTFNQLANISIHTVDKEYHDQPNTIIKHHISTTNLITQNLSFIKDKKMKNR